MGSNNHYKPLSNGTFGCKLNELLDSKTCDSILDSAIDFNKSTTAGIHTDADYSKLRKVQTFFDSQQWVYEAIWPFMETANKSAEWEFEIESAEPYQISKYEVGDFYSWHIDGLGTKGTAMMSKDKKHPGIDGKTRKMSMSLILNDDFEGGDLELYDIGKVEQEKGNLIFFPSFMPHQVTPVTKGIRYSLVMWFLGNPWV